jgi:outer membrane protein assembly factor BamB
MTWSTERACGARFRRGRGFVPVLAACAALLPSPALSGEAPASEERVRALIHQLGSDDFQERESATAELEMLDEDMMPLLQEARTRTQDAEIITRLEHILGRHVPGDVLWESEPLGPVEASPVVLGGRLWVGAQTPKGPALCCLSAARGTVLWKADVDTPLAAAPAAEGDRVFCVDRDGTLWAFESLTGKPLWHRSLGAEVRADPAILDGRLFLARADGRVDCIRADTGEPAWSCALGAAGVTRSGPAVADGRVYVGGRDGKVRALDAATGAKRWEFDAGAAIVTTPAVDGGRVVVGLSDRRLLALSSDGGRPLWSYAAKGPVMAPPALTRDRAILLTANGELHVLELRDGALQWSAGVPFSPGLAPVSGADAVFWVDTGNSVVCGRSSDGARAWRTPLREGASPHARTLVSGPALAGRRLFVADVDGRVLCYASGITGSAAWPMAGGNARRTGRLESAPALPPK